MYNTLIDTLKSSIKDKNLGKIDALLLICKIKYINNHMTHVEYDAICKLIRKFYSLDTGEENLNFANGPGYLHSSLDDYLSITNLSSSLNISTELDVLNSHINFIKFSNLNRFYKIEFIKYIDKYIYSTFKLKVKNIKHSLIPYNILFIFLSCLMLIISNDTFLSNISILNMPSYFFELPLYKHIVFAFIFAISATLILGVFSKNVFSRYIVILCLTLSCINILQAYHFNKIVHENTKIKNPTLYSSSKNIE